MPGVMGFLMAIGCTLAGAWIFWSGFRALRVQKLIESTPSSRIGSMAMGLVEVQGSVALRSRVSAPFSNRPCGYWELEIATRTNRGNRGMSEWSTVHSARSGHPFFLQDDSGVALVYPQGADVRLPWSVEEHTNGFGVPEMYMDYMKEHGLGMRTLWSVGPMRFREKVLEEGAAMYVIGRANPKSMAQAVSDDEVVLAATGTSGGARSMQTLDQRTQGVIRKTPGDPVFVISGQSEKQMVAEYGLRAFAGVVGGPIVTLIGAWFLMLLIQSGRVFGQ